MKANQDEESRNKEKQNDNVAQCKGSLERRITQQELGFSWKQDS